MGLVVTELTSFTQNQLIGIASIHAFATVYMCGVIWFVQLVHYPLHGFVGQRTFSTYQSEHVRRTSWVVMGPMLVELACALILLVALPKAISSTWTIVGFLLLVKAWVSTGLLSVPAHQALARGFEVSVHRKLVFTNWVRTFAWTLRAPIALKILIITVSGSQS